MKLERKNIMRLYIICLIVNLVGCKKRIEYKSDETSASHDAPSAEEPEDVLTPILNLSGNVRQLFAVELGLRANGHNMICSPISAMMPLAKLLLGARQKSNSEEELLAALGLQSTKKLKSTYLQILNELENLQDVELHLASKIYASDKVILQRNFKNKSQSIFRSSVTLVDTRRPEEVADRINIWVAKKTNDMIQNLISKDDIDESASLILVNAIYFKGLWREPFLPAVQGPFYSPSGIIHVPMMSKRGKFRYSRSDDLNAQIIELPYKGEEAAMIIVLPYAKNGLPILLSTLKLSQDLLMKALLDMRMVMIDVTIPKFQIETSIDLKSYYEKMEIKHSLYHELTGLSKIVKNEKVYISSAIQKAVIEVSEEGTVAAAASALQVVPLSLQFSQIKFKADSPFLFYVSGNREQLFAGIVNLP